MRSEGASRRSDSLTDRMVDFVMASYVTTWGELAARLNQPMNSPHMLQAIRRRAFTQNVIVALPAGKNDPPIGDALVFRHDALESVVNSSRLWKLAFRYLRGNSTHMHSAGELKTVFKSSPLKAAFSDAVRRALATGTLPTGVVAVLRRGHFYLLLQEDLLPSPTVPRSAPTIPTLLPYHEASSEDDEAEDVTEISATPFASAALMSERAGDGVAEAFEAAFERAFARLDMETGRKNFIKLLSLRKALSQYPREVFDRELNALRRAGRFSLDAAEGTHDRTTQEERDAGVVEAGRRLLYCARR